MKILSITILTLLSFPSLAVELYSCTDDSGKTHYTNLPENSLDSNCHSKDHYTVMLEQDYANLASIYQQYEVEEIEEVDKDTPLDLTTSDISPDAIKSKVSDIFDPDKALEELMEATEDRDDVFTRAMRGRSEGIKNVLEQGNSGTP